MNGYSRYTPDITVSACGREWVLHRPANLEDLWDAMSEEDFGDDERLPYWVELWPASLALADWLTGHADSIRGQRCLDLGCGLGLTAMAGTMAGARVIAMDYEPEALAYARKNAEANGVPQPLWTVMDWRFPAVRAGSVAFLWGGDVMYERRFVEPVLRFMNHVLAPNGRAWMAEPSRDVYQSFRAALFSGGWTAERVYSGRLPALYEQPERVSVNLWELARG